MKFKRLSRLKSFGPNIKKQKDKFLKTAKEFLEYLKDLIEKEERLPAIPSEVIHLFSQLVFISLKGEMFMIDPAQGRKIDGIIMPPDPESIKFICEGTQEHLNIMRVFGFEPFRRN